MQIIAIGIPVQVSGCQEEVCHWIKGTATKRTESSCSTKYHQFDYGNEVFSGEDVSRGGFW